MLSMLSNFVGELLGWEETVKTLTNEEEEELIKQYKEELKADVKKIEERTGVITSTGVNFAVIDDSYMFSLEDLVFSVGDTVRFKVETTKSGEKWTFNVKPFKKPTIVDEISGKIYKVEDSFYYFIPGDYKFRCVDIKMDFKPMKGDLVTLTGSFDENNIRIDSLKATDSKLISEKITQYDVNTFEGIIGYDIFFRKSECDFDPKVGLTALCHVVETDQSIRYRAIEVNLVKDQLNQPRRQTIFIAEIPSFTLSVGETQKIDVNVKNLTSRTINIASFNCSLDDSDEFKFIEPTNKHIIPHGYVIYTFECSGILSGRRTEATLVWDFSSFRIRRKISFMTVLAHRNQPTLVYQDRRRLTQPNYPARRMRNYDLPDSLKDRKDQDDLATRIFFDENFPSLNEELNPDNYLEKMHTLLYLEEVKIIAMTDQLTGEYPILPFDNVTVLFEFDMDSPLNNLSFGDSVFLAAPWDQETQFKGTIRLIMSGKFHVEVHHKFMNEFKPRTMYLVRFVKSRSCIKRSHFAIDNVKSYDLFHRLFPKPLKMEPCSINHVEKWFNSALNTEQKRAVTNILSQKNKEYPYVIYGPPGTGKTVTVVEIIMQLVQIESSKIMIVAPTNSAIDIIGVKLLEAGLPKHNMVRLCSYNAYYMGTISAALADISFIPRSLGEDVKFKDDMPTLSPDKLALHKVTLGTAQSISSFCTSEYAQGHFTHLIIDEAGQITEPDALIPISLLDNLNQSQLILAGDPMQLGPTVFSHNAKNFGLGRSLLKRLTDTIVSYGRHLDIYKSTLGYDPRIITKLVVNYRSLPKIVKLTSEIFYDGHLIPSLDENSDEAKRLKDVKLKNESLNTKSVIFCDVDGRESTLSNSSSFFNQAEISKIVLVLKDLYLYFRPEEVGIITPYRLQVKMITERLEFHQMFCPKIGCVEEFQGAEKEVIIFSIVRNREDSNKLPEFITNRNKLNVALSRAKLLNIIVGSKRYVCENSIWASILKHCE